MDAIGDLKKVCALTDSFVNRNLFSTVQCSEPLYTGPVCSSPFKLPSSWFDRMRQVRRFSGGPMRDSSFESSNFKLSGA